MEGISKEELNAFTQAHEKTATVLEKIAGQLEQIVIKQDKLVDKLDNGFSEIIIEGVTKNYNNVHKETIVSLTRLEEGVEINRGILTDKIPVVVASTINNSSIAKDVEHTKWFVAIATLVIIIVSVFFRIINTNTNNKENQVLIHLLQQHIDYSDKGKNVTSLP